MRPYVLDTTTFTCKACCSRSVYGKVKPEFAVSCCNCPPNNEYTGYCLSSNETKEANSFSINPIYILKDIYKEHTSVAIVLFSLVLFIIATLLLIFAISMLRKSCSKKDPEFEYSRLNQNINENDSDETFDRNNGDYNNTNLNEEDDDYELNNSDYKAFNGKIKASTKGVSQSSERNGLLETRIPAWVQTMWDFASLL